MSPPSGGGMAKESEAEMDSDFDSHIEQNRGDARFRGSDISVYRIAALHPHNTIDEIPEDYPSVDGSQVTAAIAYAEANPQQSNSYPTSSFKRTLDDLVTLGVFD